MTAETTVEPFAPFPTERLTGHPTGHLTGQLTDFTRAARTALRFLALPAIERTRVLGDLAHLEAEIGSGEVRPRLAAALRYEIETAIEGHLAVSDDPLDPIAG